jgi:hypothetical protein
MCSELLMLHKSTASGSHEPRATMEDIQQWQSDLVKRLLELAPDSIETQTAFSFYLSIFQCKVAHPTLEAYPKGVEIQEKDGYLPLHST